jgi:peroxiredoxin
MNSQQQPLQAGNPAPDVPLAEEQGRPVRMSDFWVYNPTVFVFIRHFG